MRPGQLRPGNACGSRARRRPFRCFNEAGAASPRKRADARGAGCGGLRFNEAGAASPRKPDGAHDPDLTLGASMRPGQLRPGNDESRRVRGHHRRASMRPGQLRPGNRKARRPGALQGRSGFNEAGAASPRKRPHPRHPFRHQGASMRPGQLRPGNPGGWRRPGRTVVCFNEAGAASPRKRGRLSGLVDPPDRFNEAGAASPRKRGKTEGMVKWFWGFNEAGAASPRKQRVRPSHNIYNGNASMRPGQLRPGNQERC